MKTRWIINWHAADDPGKATQSTEAVVDGDAVEALKRFRKKYPTHVVTALKGAGDVEELDP